MKKIWACLIALTLSGGLAVAEENPGSGRLIRLLPPAERLVTGRVMFEALVIEPNPWSVVFFLDGVEVERRKLPPWEARLRLDDPAREQLVRVEVENKSGTVLGADEIVVNRPRRRLRVKIESIDVSADGFEVSARVSTPESVELESVAVFLNDTEVSTLLPDEVTNETLRVAVAQSEPSTSDYVRVEARLQDGRKVEDVALVAASGFTEEVDVRLVQLQVLVTDKRGAPIRGLSREHFKVEDDGELREPAGVFVANDVSLLLGLSLDSSGSMKPLWPATREAASSFLSSTLTARDRGFLVDFDTRLRLIRESTSDLASLEAGLGELEPEGGTALYDSILYSLLQFDRQQGRRGLVVLTDGVDSQSQASPKRVVEFSQKLGVPIYILALEPRVAGSGGRLGMGAGGNVQALRLLTEPSGGRLYRVPSAEHVLRAFAQIQAEMRNQYVLTYYTKEPPEPGSPPSVEVNVPDMKGLRVRTVFGQDQIY